jgi:hypothetical protein
MMRLPLATVAALGALLVPPGARAETPADVAAARELFVEAARLAKEGKWAPARDAYARSLALKDSPLTLYSLAQAQAETGELVAALEGYRRFVRSTQTAASAAYVTTAEQEIASLERRVARVTLRLEGVPPPGLVVTVDGASVPVAALGVARLVDPGRHTVAASAEGRAPFRSSFEVAEGSSADVELRLDAAAHAPSAPATEALELAIAEAPEARNEAPAIALPVALMAGGAVVATVGVVVGAVGYAEADGVAPGSPEADAARSKGIAGDVLMVTGLVSATAGLIVLLVAGGAEADATTDAAPWRRDVRRGLAFGF